MLDVWLINYSIRRWWGSKLLWILVIFSLLWKPILVRGKEKVRLHYVPWYTVFKKRKSLRKSQLLLVPKWYPMHFPPSDRNKSKPSNEFAGDRNNLLTWSAFQTSGQTNRMTYFPRFAFNLSKVIFFAYSYFLLVCLWSVLFVCLTFSCSYFIIKWKVRFCFIVARNNLTMHTANYRMNDVTMIYRILI